MTVEELHKILDTAYKAKFVLAGDASHWTCTDYEILKFAAMIASAEREACAKVAEKGTLAGDAHTLGHFLEKDRISIAAAIRARGE